MPVAAEELAGFPKIRWSRSGDASGERELICAWSDRYTLATELFGGYRYIAGTPVYSPGVPFPGFPAMYCDEVSIEPYGSNAAPEANSFATGAGYSINSYSKAKVRATYKQDQNTGGVGPDVPDGTYLTLEADSKIDVLTVPGRTWKWDTDNTLVKTDVGVPLQIPTIDFVLTWDRTPVIPHTAIRACVGRINNATFLGWPIGTVLFMGCKITGKFQPNGDQLWSLAYSFQAKGLDSTASPGTLLDYSWNRFYRETAASSEHWLKIESNDASKPPYQTANFSSLFVITS